MFKQPPVSQHNFATKTLDSSQPRPCPSLALGLQISQFYTLLLIRYCFHFFLHQPCYGPADP